MGLTETQSPHTTEKCQKMLVLMSCFKNGTKGHHGEVAEWSKAPVSKTGNRETGSRVQIPSSPHRIETRTIATSRCLGIRSISGLGLKKPSLQKRAW
jgi:hypothetical protein